MGPRASLGSADSPTVKTNSFSEAKGYLALITLTGFKTAAPKQRAATPAAKVFPAAPTDAIPVLKKEKYYGYLAENIRRHLILVAKEHLEESKSIKKSSVTK